MSESVFQQCFLWFTFHLSMIKIQKKKTYLYLFWLPEDFLGLPCGGLTGFIPGEVYNHFVFLFPKDFLASLGCSCLLQLSAIRKPASVHHHPVPDHQREGALRALLEGHYLSWLCFLTISLFWPHR